MILRKFLSTTRKNSLRIYKTFKMKKVVLISYYIIINISIIYGFYLEDEQFNEEKTLLIKTLSNLQMPPPAEK